MNNRKTVYIFGASAASGRWSLQQRLFGPNDTASEIVTESVVYSDRKNTMFTTIRGPEITSTYIFKTFGNGWSLQSRILSYNKSIDGTHYYDTERNQSVLRPPITNFTSPQVYGSTMISTAQNEVQVRTQFHYGSCLIIWLSDHFLDGWDTAVLTVRAPDLTNDTFHPHCDQVSC